VKGLFISNVDDRVTFGYLPKLMGQVRALVLSGLGVRFLSFSRGELQFRDYNSDGSCSKVSTIVSDVGGLFSKRWHLLHQAWLYLLNSEVNFIYIRYNPFDPFLVIFLLLVRWRCKAVQKIIVEMPTYPYDKYLLSSGLLSFTAMQWLLDIVCRPFLHWLVDRSVVVNCRNLQVFGMPVISITNGVDVDSYAHHTPLFTSPGSVHLVFVGNIHDGHGLDRLVHGLARYYEDSSQCSLDVTLTVIGGRESGLRELCEKIGVLDKVKFVGHQEGLGLDDYLREATIGVGVLASYRLNMEDFSPLKHREYCARGIPFIYDGNDTSFRDTDFALNLGMNDQPIDIRSVIAFASTVARPGLSDAMRAYAKQNFSWSSVMVDVINYLKKENADAG
jgi:glycosyltransferase involved in cell wall biosynthesis